MIILLSLKVLRWLFMKSSLWPALGGTVWCHLCQGHQADLIPLWSRFSLVLIYWYIASPKAGNITPWFWSFKYTALFVGALCFPPSTAPAISPGPQFGDGFLNGKMDSSYIRGRCCPPGKTLTLGEEELSSRLVILIILWEEAFAWSEGLVLSFD